MTDERLLPLDELTDAIGSLMIDFGPDGHCDGAEVLVYFVDCLTAGDSVADALSRTREIAPQLTQALHAYSRAQSDVTDLRLSRRSPFFGKQR